MNLLERAKSRRVIRKAHYVIDKDLIDVALAWLNGEVTYSQVQYGLTEIVKGNPTVYSIIARALRVARATGRIQIQGMIEPRDGSPLAEMKSAPPTAGVVDVRRERRREANRQI
jgi:hypothetical protein